MTPNAFISAVRTPRPPNNRVLSPAFYSRCNLMENLTVARTFSWRVPSTALRRVPGRTTGSFRWDISRTVQTVTWRPAGEWKKEAKR